MFSKNDIKNFKYKNYPITYLPYGYLYSLFFHVVEVGDIYFVFDSLVTLVLIYIFLR